MCRRATGSGPGVVHPEVTPWTGGHRGPRHRAERAGENAEGRPSRLRRVRGRVLRPAAAYGVPAHPRPDPGRGPPAGRVGQGLVRVEAAGRAAGAVRPQDPGLPVGDGEHEVAVLRRTPELGLDVRHSDLQRGALPEGPGVGLVGHGRLGDVPGDSGLGAPPAAQDLRAHQRLGRVAVLDERRPRLQRGHPAVAQLTSSAHVVLLASP